MLKAQLHPHFLFNTLNNIYSHTQQVSATASGMIMDLSVLLRYILYECNKPLICLDRELNMISDYLRLEKARYSNDLDLSVSLPDDTGELCIAPLLLLPFVENAFKHGAGNMIEDPWISLAIQLEENRLVMQLINGFASGSTDLPGGIGIANVRKRLEMLYPDRHELQITNEEDIFIVNLKIALHE
jgi:LytS/YehU family sensor histidine kinase